LAATEFSSGFAYGFLTGAATQDCVNLVVVNTGSTYSTAGDTSPITLDVLTHNLPGGGSGLGSIGNQFEDH